MRAYLSESPMGRLNTTVRTLPALSQYNRRECRRPPITTDAPGLRPGAATRTQLRRRSESVQSESAVRLPRMPVPAYRSLPNEWALEWPRLPESLILVAVAAMPGALAPCCSKPVTSATLIGSILGLGAVKRHTIGVGLQPRWRPRRNLPDVNVIMRCRDVDLPARSQIDVHVVVLA